MRERRKRIARLRELELAYLVEGQSNSVSAIRLKETLPLGKTRLEVPVKLSDRERLRVQELLQ